MKTSRVLPVLLWSLGGAINAAHCYFKPVSPEYAMQWHIIPAGALHSLTLALIPLIFASAMSEKKLFARIIGMVAAGYVAGWVSGIFLGFSIDQKWTPERLWWPVRYGFSVEDTLLSPFSFFGLVSAFYFFYLRILNGMRESRVQLHVLAAALCGVLGALWFWNDIHAWHIGIIHGIIWGVCTGLGTWTLGRRNGF